MSTTDRADFFISYNGADTAWANWICGVLEKNGFTTIVQSRDFRPGQNFVLRMHEAAEKAKRTIGVLTPNYLRSEFAATEWAAAFAKDPHGADAKFIPVRVEDCEPSGLLKGIIYLDLVGKDEVAATEALLQGLGTERPNGPTDAPFPGAAHRNVTADVAPNELQFRALNTGHPQVVWRGLRDPGFISSAGTVVQVHLVPERASLIGASRLQEIAQVLSATGRSSGLFSDSAGVDVSNDAQSAMAVSVTDDHSESGLIVTREGQRGAWLTLPRDSMGAVFDTEDVRRRLTQLFPLLIQLAVSRADRYALAAALTGTTMLTFGSRSVLNNRNSATFASFGGDDLLVEPTDTVSFADLQRSPSELADEVVTRLELAFRAR